MAAVGCCLMAVSGRKSNPRRPQAPQKYKKMQKRVVAAARLEVTTPESKVRAATPRPQRQPYNMGKTSLTGST